MEKDNEFEKMQNTNSKRVGSPDVQEKVQKVSLDDIKKIKDEIKKENDIPSEEITANSKPVEMGEEGFIAKPKNKQKKDVDLDQKSNNDEINNSSEETENTKLKKVAVKDNLVFFSSSPNDNDIEEDNNDDKEEQPVINIVKKEMPKKKHGLFGKKNNESHVEKVDLSELEEAKKAIYDGKNSSEDEIDTEYDETDGSIKSRIVKQKKTIFSKPEETYVAPDESLPDDITEADIIKQMEQDELKNVPADDEELYKGMTEEEIIEAKERKRRLDDLKHKYNDRETKDPNDVGDYRKNLDFSINKDIKRFRIKPPKKPFIIASIITAVILILATVLTIVIINRPPEAVVLSSIRLSQKTTYQYVGDDLDLRGLYIEKVFSDKHVETIKVTSDMISSTSENIDGTLKIASMNDNTFVKFSYQGYSDTLTVVLTNPTISRLYSADIYQSEISKDGVIEYDHIVILATAIDPVSGDILGYKRIDSKEAIYSFESLNKTLVNGQSGVQMDGETVGTVILTITYKIDGNTFSISKEIKII